MSYGTNIPALFRRSADFVDKSLRRAQTWAARKQVPLLLMVG
jgi:hypothetical protein